MRSIKNMIVILLLAPVVVIGFLVFPKETVQLFRESWAKHSKSQEPHLAEKE